MKRFKKVFILLGVAAFVFLATVLVTQIEEKKEQIKNTDETIIAVAPDSVTSLSWEYEGTSLSFSKNDNWQWAEDAAFPVNEEKINELLETFKDFGAAFIIEDVEDFGQYGLDNPTCTIRFSTEDNSYEVLLGAFSTMDSQRYVSIGDGNVYLVKTDPFDTFNIQLSDTILHDDTPSFDKVSGITFSGAENYSITYEEDSTATYCSSDRYYTEIDGKTVPLDTYRVEAYYADISLLNLSNYVSYNAGEAELAEWGLDDPALTVTVNYSSASEEDDGNETPETFVMHIGRNKEELAAKEESEKAAAAAKEAGNEPETDPDSLTVTSYVRIGDSKLVYEIDASDYDTLSAVSYNDLRHKEILTADFSDVTQIDISLEGETYTITATVSEDESKDEETIGYTYNGEEISGTELQNKIEALSVNTFNEDRPKDKEEISLLLHLNNENHPLIKVVLYRYDGTNCLAVVNGKTVGLVSRSSVVNLIEAVNGIILG